MSTVTFNERTKNYFSFTLNLPISFANSLRRTLLSEIPSISLDIVHITKNTSVLPDDLIVHRIGLIPIFTDKKLTPSHLCSCKTFCPECSITCELNVENYDDEIRPVWSSEFMCDFATFPNLMIAKLAKKHAISLTAIGRVNIGKVNAKFSPVNVVEYEYDTNNVKEHTRYWFEEDAVKEWPELEEKNVNEGDVRLGVEVQDGYDAMDVVKSGLEVMKKRFVELRDMIENYVE